MVLRRRGRFVTAIGRRTCRRRRRQNLRRALHGTLRESRFARTALEIPMLNVLPRWLNAAAFAALAGCGSQTSSTTPPIDDPGGTTETTPPGDTGTGSGGDAGPGPQGWAPAGPTGRPIF